VAASPQSAPRRDRAAGALGADALSRPGETGLFARLTWLTAIRLVVVTALLGMTAWVSLRSPDEFEARMQALLFGIAGFVYAVSVGYLFVLRGRRQLAWLAQAQVAGDMIMATYLVYITGGADSVFTLMYPLAIVNAAVLLRRTGAVLAAAGAAVAFAGLSLAMQRGWVPPAAPYLAQRPLTDQRLAFVALVNGTAFVAAAALTSYLTEQLRRTGERLERSETDYAALSELHGSIVRAMASGILVTDSGGRITFMNPAAESITGLPFPELADEPVATHLPALARAARAALGDPRARGEVDERGAGGIARRLEFVVNPVTLPAGRRRDGAEPALAIVFDDRTEIHAMQERIRKADRMAAVGALAAGLAHELRNPLASMSGAIELLSSTATLSGPEKRLLEIVLRESGRLNALVTDFLAFARPMPVQRQPSDLAAMADETLNVFRHHPGASRLELQRTGAERLWTDADPSQIRQVLWNLLVNAADAVGSGPGRVAVDVSRASGGECRLAVTDTGRGIPPDELPRLFEPFYTTKENGTGLGLAVVHRIVEAHGGQVLVSSTLGAGATFALLLPAADEPMG